MYPWGHAWKITDIVNFPLYIRDKKNVNHAALIERDGNYQFVLFSDMLDGAELREFVTLEVGKTLVRGVFDAQTCGQSGYLRNILEFMRTWERDSSGAISTAQSYEEWRFRVPV